MDTGKHNPLFCEMWIIFNKYLTDGLNNKEALERAKKDLNIN